MDYLVGSGHFAFGFIIGFVMMLLGFRLKNNSLNAQLYLPFFPFILGILAALPYLVLESETATPGWSNLFLGYAWLHTQEWAIKFLGRPNWVALICGSLYGLILLRYIWLAKKVRREGWPQLEDSHAG